VDAPLTRCMCGPDEIGTSRDRLPVPVYPVISRVVPRPVEFVRKILAELPPEFYVLLYVNTDRCLHWMVYHSAFLITPTIIQ
jgi:hypothetical protein